MECYASERVSGPCHECGATGAVPIHVVSKKVGEKNGRSILETRFYCKNCCPIHCQATLDWGELPTTLDGEQKGLF